MTTRDPNTILAADWVSGNCTTPAFITEPYQTHFTLKRGISQRIVRDIGNYMGIISRTYYTPESHDAWLMKIIAETRSDCEDIKEEVRRICAAFTPTATEKILTWEGGDYTLYSNSRYEFTFTLFVKKSGITIG